MTKVTFNDNILYFQVPYYDRYNWDLIDAIRNAIKLLISGNNSFAN